MLTTRPGSEVSSTEDQLVPIAEDGSRDLGSENLHAMIEEGSRDLDLENLYEIELPVEEDVSQPPDAEVLHATDLEQPPYSAPVHPDPAKFPLLLGESFLQKYTDTGNIQALEAAIENYQAVVDLTPEGHPKLAEHLKTLAFCFTQRYQELGELEDLNAAVQKDQEAVDLIKEGHPDRAEYLQSLSISHADRYQRLGDLKDLEATLRIKQEILELTPEGHFNRPESLQYLAESFINRYLRLRDLNDLELAIQMDQEALDLTLESHSDRAGCLEALGNSLHQRYQRLADIKDLCSAQQRHQEALDITPEGHPDRARLLRNLSACSTDQYQRSGEIKDLDAAVEKNQEAVDITPDAHPDKASHLDSLATSFRDRYMRLGNLEDLEAALGNNRAAVEITSAVHPDRARYVHGLAVSLGARYQRLGDLHDLQTSHQSHQEVVNLTPKWHPDRAEHLYFLAASFGDLYQRSGALSDLQGSLQNYQEAINLTPERHPDKATRLAGLAGSFGDRYHRLGELEDLQAVVQNCQEAVSLTPEGHSDRAGYLRSLAGSFGDRYQRLGDLDDLEAALQNYQEAVNLTPEGRSERPGFLKGLAASFADQYHRFGNLDDLHAALQNYQEAVNLIPKEHPDRPQYLDALGVCFRDRYQKLGDMNDLESALQNTQDALDLTEEGSSNRGRCLQSLAMLYIYQYAKSRDPEDLKAVHTHYSASFNTPTLTPQISWKHALDWATFAGLFQSSYSLIAFTIAFNLLPEILWIGHTIQVRHAAIRRLGIGQATSTAARTCITLSEFTSAVKILEQGLATIFQQMLQLKTDVDFLQPDQAKVFQKLSSELYSGISTDSMNLVIQRNELLENIRRQPGLEYFLLPNPYSSLCQASQGGPVVILNSHENGCDGIIIINPSSNPVHVPLPNVTLDLLKSQQSMLEELLRQCNLRTRGESASRLFGHREGFSTKTSEECFADILTWLWTWVVAPIYQVLDSHDIYKGRIWWLPTGAFAGLPLHASPPTDQFIHSYTATLGSLLDAYAKQPSISMPKIGVVGVTHTGPGERNYLKGVGQEIQKVCSVLQNSDLDCLEGEQAIPDAVKQQVQQCSWVHLACHGKQDLDEPTKSHLLLYGGMLELREILQMSLLNAEFVFLAACQTAMGDSELVNESFHLGGGFIAAGFRGAIGTLWSMNDQDGPLVAEIVYSHLFHDGHQPQASDAAEALQFAVKELKARKVPYERWIPFIHMGI